MTTRSNHFSEIVLTPLFVLFICAMVEESGQILSKPSTKECLRKCAFARTERSTTKVSRFLSCYRTCLNWNIDDQHALSKNTYKQRTRKALAPNPDCRDSSPGQSVEWTPSKVNVSFGQYENTSCWYVNVSWTPINDTDGNWTGILVRLTIPTTDWFATPINCFVQPTNQTFLRINISSYHYHYPNHIFVNIIALPYSSDISGSLKIFVPNITTSPPSTATTATISTTPRTSGCYNEYGDLVWYPKRVNADFVQGNIKDWYWYANISWTPLTDPTVTWTGYLLTVFVGDVLTSVGVSKAVQCFKLPKNRTYIIVDSSHGWKYPESISVNVTAYPRPRFEIADMILFYPVQYTTSILTEGLPEPATSASSNPQTKTRDVVIIVFLSVGGVAVVLVIAVFLRWRKKPPSDVAEETPTKRFKYHAFIIYSMLDSEWVNTTLIPTLQRYDFKCCVHWKDFLPGKVFTESIVESVHNSYKIIAVVSSNFISSNSCDFELQHAITRLMNNRDDCLIVIKFDEEGVEGLPASILNRSYIDFTQRTDRSTWESKLAEILNKAVIEDDSSGASTISTTDNNSRLSEAGNSTDGSEGRDLICSCQSV